MRSTCGVSLDATQCFQSHGFSADCLSTLWREEGLKGPIATAALLPAEFGGSPRNLKLDRNRTGPVEVLCVSTLEPRKNHRKLVAAFLHLKARHPELCINLHLVGNKYAGAFEIAEYVQTVSATHPELKWHGIVSDDTLRDLYARAWFTVYPSQIEGYGMPIVESIWNGRPCICSHAGVMSELAAGGGVLTTDINDELALADAIYQLAVDTSLREEAHSGDSYQNILQPGASMAARL